MYSNLFPLNHELKSVQNDYKAILKKFG